MTKIEIILLTTDKLTKTQLLALMNRIASPIAKTSYNLVGQTEVHLKVF